MRESFTVVTTRVGHDGSASRIITRAGVAAHCIERIMGMFGVAAQDVFRRAARCLILCNVQMVVDLVRNVRDQ